LLRRSGQRSSTVEVRRRSGSSVAPSLIEPIQHVRAALLVATAVAEGHR
jgi:hypothetical protein